MLLDISYAGRIRLFHINYPARYVLQYFNAYTRKYTKSNLIWLKMPCTNLFCSQSMF
jgi:hypothetical protein